MTPFAGRNVPIAFRNLLIAILIGMNLRKKDCMTYSYFCDT